MANVTCYTHFSHFLSSVFLIKQHFHRNRVIWNEVIVDQLIILTQERPILFYITNHTPICLCFNFFPCSVATFLWSSCGGIDRRSRSAAGSRLCSVFPNSDNERTPSWGLFLLLVFCVCLVPGMVRNHSKGFSPFFKTCFQLH